MNTIRLSIILILLLTLQSQTTLSQPAINWHKAYGGGSGESFNSIQKTPDGGYIAIGTAASTDGDVNGNHGISDVWVVKLKGTGSIEWAKCFGGSGAEIGNYIITTSDGGYLFCAQTGSTDGDVTGKHAGIDGWVVKLTSSGSISWQKCLGGSGAELFRTVQQTADGGYILAGLTSSTDGDITSTPKGGNDIWVVKITSTGSLSWEKCLGGSSGEDAYSITVCTDGGYIIAGSTQSTDGDVTANNGQHDAWIVKTDNSGTIQWQKTFGSTQADQAKSVIELPGTGYLCTGNAVTANSFSLKDFWVAKLNYSGGTIWEKNYGGTATDEASCVIKADDTTYVVTGYTQSKDSNVTGLNDVFGDIWLIGTDTNGSLKWQQTLGSSRSDLSNAVIKGHNSLLVVGSITAADSEATGSGYHTGTNNPADAWVVSVGNYTGVSNIFERIGDISVYPTITSDIVHIDLNTGVDNINITLSDIEGRPVKTDIQKQATRITLKISNMPPGIYILSVDDGQRRNTYKITYLP